jgi:hypothetical protein
MRLDKDVTAHPSPTPSKQQTPSKQVWEPFALTKVGSFGDVMLSGGSANGEAGQNMMI